MKKFLAVILILLILILAVVGYAIHKFGEDRVKETFEEILPFPTSESEVYDDTNILSDVPEWEGLPFAYVNENVPVFSDDEIWTSVQESLDPLDELGRCGSVIACIGKECMPEGDRAKIGNIHPTGWQSDKYDFIEGGYLYNRCHLMAYQLTGDEGIDRNLITGTRYMNISGMLPFENAVASYVRLTGRHVMYRVTPIFKGKELVARGVHLEAMSVEDGGKALSFNVFCYNVQPGVEIKYSNGRNKVSNDEKQTELLEKYQEGRLSAFPRTKGKVTQEELDKLLNKQSKPKEYYVNTYSGKIHLEGCPKIAKSKPEHIHIEVVSKEELLYRGFEPCTECKP